MFPFYTDDHQLLARSISSFMEKESPREYVRKCDQERKYPYELYESIGKMGWFGVLMPETYGGSEADFISYAVLNEHIGKYHFDMAIAYGLTTWGLNTLLNWGTETQKKELIPKVIKGEKRLSISITEPNAGSDAAALSTSAVKDGGYYIVNGQKVFSTAADVDNNIIILAVRTQITSSKYEGISILLLDNKTEGIEFRHLPTLARRSLGTTEVFFDNVKIPVDNLIGNEGDGWKILSSHLEIERISAAASCIGYAETIVNDAIKYAKERIQVGKSISKQQVIQHMLVDMHMSVEAARLLVYKAAWMKEQKIPCKKDASMAKVLASEVAFDSATKGMQILGGYAQIPEYDMERYWRDTKQLMVGGGTSQIQRNIIAKQLVL